MERWQFTYVEKMVSVLPKRISIFGITPNPLQLFYNELISLCLLVFFLMAVPAVDSAELCTAGSDDDFTTSFTSFDGLPSSCYSYYHCPASNNDLS